MNDDTIISQLIEANKTLVAENERLRADIDRLCAENAQLAATNARLTARIEELERRTKQNSRNSSRPPSLDGLDKPSANGADGKQPPRTGGLRKPSGKSSGGQPGHEGSNLSMTANPDIVVDHFPERCDTCGTRFTEENTTGYRARQVVDIPPIALEVTEHRAHGCRCSHCGRKKRAPFPADVAAPVQYGPRIGAVATYLTHAHMIPEDRLSELMGDLFGAKIVPATLARISQNCAKRFRGVFDRIGDAVRTAAVKHLDETGFRVGGRTCWLHVASTEQMTFYRVDAKRGSMLENVTGVIVHDHLKSYYRLEGVQHALCNAHHLRELRALVEIEKEEWAGKMQNLLQMACHRANCAREQVLPLSSPMQRRIMQCYDAIVTRGLAYHEAQPALVPDQPGRRGRPKRRIGHNLLLRFEKFREDVLHFLADLSVPFTNN